MCRKKKPLIFEETKELKLNYANPPNDSQRGKPEGVKIKENHMKSDRTTIYLIVIILVAVGGVLYYFVEFPKTNPSERGKTEELDPPIFDLPLIESAQINAENFEKSMTERFPSEWDLEAYMIDSGAAETLQYYEFKITDWGEPKRDFFEKGNFEYHMLTYERDRDRLIITVAETEEKNEIYLAIIGYRE